jgi:hypothetical protein
MFLLSRGTKRSAMFSAVVSFQTLDGTSRALYKNLYISKSALFTSRSI